MVGLDAAGKTTILYKLKLGEIVTTIPTIGKSLTFSPPKATFDRGFLNLAFFNLESYTSLECNISVTKSKPETTVLVHSIMVLVLV